MLEGLCNSGWDEGPVWFKAQKVPASGNSEDEEMRPDRK